MKAARIVGVERERLLADYRAALLAGGDGSECVAGLRGRCSGPEEFAGLFAELLGVMIEVALSAPPSPAPVRRPSPS